MFLNEKYVSQVNENIKRSRAKQGWNSAVPRKLIEHPHTRRGDEIEVMSRTGYTAPGIQKVGVKTIINQAKTTQNCSETNQTQTFKPITTPEQSKTKKLMDNAEFN